MKRAIEKNLVSIGNDSALKYTTTTKHVYNGLTHQHQRVSNMSIYEKIMFVNFNRPSVSMSHDIFTKEMKDGAHFRRLRDCMMCSKASYLKYHSNVPSEVVTAEKILPYYSIRSQTNPSPVWRSPTVKLQHCRQGGVVLESTLQCFREVCRSSHIWVRSRVEEKDPLGIGLFKPTKNNIIILLLRISLPTLFYLPMEDKALYLCVTSKFLLLSEM